MKRLRTVSSAPRENVGWAWVLQNKQAAVKVFVGDFKVVYAQSPQAACHLTIQLQHSAFVHQTTSQKGTVCVLPESNQIV